MKSTRKIQVAASVFLALTTLSSAGYAQTEGQFDWSAEMQEASSIKDAHLKTSHVTAKVKTTSAAKTAAAAEKTTAPSAFKVHNSSYYRKHPELQISDANKTSKTDKTAKTDKGKENPTATLTGKVSVIDGSSAVPTVIQRTTELALEKNEAAQEVDKTIEKFNTKAHKALVVAKEAAYSMVPYRGFGPSKEGSQLLLEQTSKLRSMAAAEYMKRKIEDDTHTKVVSNTLQIAMALDETDPERSKQMVDRAYENLKEMIGPEEAAKTIDNMKQWSKSLNVPPTAFLQQTWDVDEMESKVKDATISAVHGDPIMHQVVDKVQKYNRGKGAMVAGTLVESGSAVASLLAPGMLIPVGVEAVNAGFVVSTGGTEETKLVNQLYYGKAMESRFRRLNKETQLALNNYQTALRTKSPTLLAAAEAVLQQVVGPDRVEKLLGQTVLASNKEKPEVPMQTADRPMTASK